MIIDSQIKDLLYELEQAPPHRDPGPLLAKLIQTLTHNCQRHPHTPHHHPPAYPHIPLPAYPTDAEGYAIAQDPLQDEAAFKDTFHTYGLVVGKQVITPALCTRAVARLEELTAALSDGTCDLRNPDTWHHMPQDAQGAPLLSRGFYEVYHDALWADIRQSLRLYLHHVVLWHRADLWTSFDRFGIKLPQSPDGKALGLHVDQNPTVHSGFKTLQGILALADNPAEQGTFRAVCGSRALFVDYAPLATNKGEYIALSDGSELAERLRPHAQAFPLHAGDIVTWDSRTTHANTSNLSDSPRFVAMVAAGPAPADFAAQQAIRKEAFASALGSNVRDALMHASQKPRFTDSARMNHHRTPENLNLLGEHLYGFRPYAS